MRLVLKAMMAVVLIVAGFTMGWVAGQTGLGRAVEPASLSERERAFADRMRNVALVGQFTIDGREDLGGRPERYEIERVVKVGENRWRFDTRMVYGSTDVTLPVTVPIEWAGDTPMGVDHQLCDSDAWHLHRARDVLRRPLRRELGARGGRWPGV